jgi:hypothetical protein
MKKMNAEKKRKVASIIAILLIASLLLSAIVPAFLSIANAATDSNSSDYTIEADLGFDGRAKVGTSIPVSISITNNSAENFSGEVAVLAAAYSEDSKYTKYSEKVEIVASGSKGVYFDVPINLIQRSVTVQLLNKKGEVAQKSFSLSVGSQADCWIGILSDDYDSVSYINPVSNRQSGCTVDLKKVLSATNKTVSLDAFNIFVIDNFDINTLSDDYLYEIQSRISEGAVLLLGNDVGIPEGSRLNTDMQANAYELSEDMQAMLDVSELLSYNDFYSLGSGYVIKSTLDLSDASRVSGDVNFSELLTYLCTNSTSNDSDIKNSLISYTDRLPNLTDNTIKVIILVLYVYIAFFPILYIVLKRKDKREAALKIIPVTALVCSFIIYLLSFNTVYKKPIASVINYFDLRNAQSDNVRLLSYMNLISPSKGSITITPEGKPEILGIGSLNYSNNYYSTIEEQKKFNSDDDIDTEVLSDAEGISITFRDKTKWDSTYLTLSEKYSLNGGIATDVDMTEDGILTGTVTNNTGIDFDTAVIIASRGNDIIYANTLDAFNSGNSVDIADYEIDALSPYNYDSSYSRLINTYDVANNSSESYKRELKQDIFNGVGRDIMSADEAVNRLKLTVLGFSSDALYGSNTKLNKSSVNGSYINVFRAETNVLYPEGAVIEQEYEYYDNQGQEQGQEQGQGQEQEQDQASYY